MRRLKSMPLLTKTNFIKYLSDPIELWLFLKYPGLIPTTAGDEKSMREGEEVDNLARNLFPNGFEVMGYNESGFENTKKAIAKGIYTVLYQPTAMADNCAARADMLVRSEGQEGWDLYEVKAITEVKSEHITDVTFQKRCFDRSGIPINNVFIVYINNQYTRNGELDLETFFVREDVTEKVTELLPVLDVEIPQAQEVFGWGDELTTEQILQQKLLKKNKSLGYWLSSLDKRTLDRVLADVPSFFIKDLLEKQFITPEHLSKKLLVKSAYQPIAVQIDKAGIKKHLASFEYPLYYYDYETYNPAVPPFDGVKPYQQIPFQVSVYVLEAPGATPKTFDFLAPTFKNPVPDLLEALQNAIGPTGTTIAWWDSFEKSRNKEMAAMYPKYADFLLGINERSYDLMMIFKQNLYMHPAFKGSNSLKAVMPVLVPGLSYKDLAIQKGDVASASWRIVTDPGLSRKKRDQLYRDMIDYCRLDVYGMVKIVDHLVEVISH